MKQPLIKGIYAITPDRPIDLAKIASILSNGVGLLQYRTKTKDKTLKYQEAKAIKQLCAQYQTPLIINDDVNLCLAINANGVHLGKNDTSIELARKKLGSTKIIGISCYNQINLAKQAQAQGADYVAFGCLFTSNTKPEAKPCALSVITQAKQQLNLPIVGIGGITKKNIIQVQQAGADAWAMVSGIFEQ